MNLIKVSQHFQVKLIFESSFPLWRTAINQSVHSICIPSWTSSNLKNEWSFALWSEWNKSHPSSKLWKESIILNQCCHLVVAQVNSSPHGLFVLFGESIGISLAWVPEYRGRVNWTEYCSFWTLPFLLILCSLIHSQSRIRALELLRTSTESIEL